MFLIIIGIIVLVLSAVLLKNNPALWWQFPDAFLDAMQYFCADAEVFRVSKTQYGFKIHLVYIYNGIFEMPGNIIEAKIPGDGI